MSRILLVDDDASLLKLMSMRLRSQGYEVDTADSAEGALDRLRQQRADLVLSDLRMGLEPDYTFNFAVAQRVLGHWEPIAPVVPPVTAAEALSPARIGPLWQAVWRRVRHPPE